MILGQIHRRIRDGLLRVERSEYQNCRVREMRGNFVSRHGVQAGILFFDCVLVARVNDLFASSLHSARCYRNRRIMRSNALGIEVGILERHIGRTVVSTQGRRRHWGAGHIGRDAGVCLGYIVLEHVSVRAALFRVTGSTLMDSMTPPGRS